jgi:tRNA-splicing ligase RtcB
MSQAQGAPAPLESWLAEPLMPDVAASIERLRRTDDVCHVAVMPDVHLASEVCVGAVVATSGTIYPAAIGGDIGCGMAAVRTNASRDLLREERSAAGVFAGLGNAVPANKHRAPRILPANLNCEPLSEGRLTKHAARDGRVQFGTLGRGNHFLEFQADHEGALWVVVHSGSRSIGQVISQPWLQSADCARAGGRAALLGVIVDSPAGRAYLHDHEWARRYASESRLAMLAAVGNLLAQLFAVALDWSTLIHADHNHVQQEEHLGKRLWVHRKGAQSAAIGEPGIIPGSMSAATFHVVGRGCDAALRSCSHGAGRRLARTAARATISPRQLARQLTGVWYDHRRTAALREEAPAAYKDIRAVMRAQRPLVRIVRELEPVLSYKGC